MFDNKFPTSPPPNFVPPPFGYPSNSTFKFGTSSGPFSGFSFGTSTTTEVHAEQNKKDSQGKKQEAEPEKIPCVEISTQTDAELHANKFLQGLKDLLQSGRYSDVKFNVNGKEFKLHKNILASHSPVFAVLVDSENPVNIDDADPDIFSDFLLFIYTGRAEKLNSDNVIDMYMLAKKYQVTELSTSCVKHMMDHISLDNFCDIMRLSLQHHEEELTHEATQYFMQNSIDIAETAKWLMFLKDNTIMGNTLFVKALKLKKKEM